VEVYGPGVGDDPANRPKARRPTEFIVDCTKSGPGDVKASVEPKGKAAAAAAARGDALPGGRRGSAASITSSLPITLADQKDGTYKVTYEPSDEGPHEISVTLDGQRVPRTPILVEVKPGLDLDAIKLKDFENEVFVDCTNEFEVDAGEVEDPPPGATVDCEVVGPSGEPVDCYVNKTEPDGPFHVRMIAEQLSI